MQERDRVSTRTLAFRCSMPHDQVLACLSGRFPAEKDPHNPDDFMVMGDAVAIYQEVLGAQMRRRPTQSD